MVGEINRAPNIKQTVPFLAVSDMEASLRFYVEGLGFEIQHTWRPKDRIEWCFLQRGGGTLMLQEPQKHEQHAGMPEDKPGVGVSVFFICEDALAIYHEITGKGIQASVPFVGNNMWVTSLRDPDGYSIEFESPTDVAEGTVYAEQA